MDNFRKYLTGLGYHWETLLQISGFGDDQKKVDQAQFATDLIGDILHHFDMFVKANQNISGEAFQPEKPTEAPKVESPDPPP